MSAVLDSGNLSEVKISPVHHYLRWAGIVIGTAMVIAAFVGFDRWRDKSDASQLAGFDDFRAVYAEKCNSPDYADAQPDVVNRAYVSSPAVRAKMAEQLAAMKAGNTYCDVVAAEMKKVDFVLPKPGM